MLDPTDPATLRLEISRTGRKLYVVAAQAGIHPCTLSTLLHAPSPVPAHRGRAILLALGVPDELIAVPASVA